MKSPNSPIPSITRPMHYVTFAEMNELRSSEDKMKEHLWEINNMLSKAGRTERSISDVEFWSNDFFLPSHQSNDFFTTTCPDLFEIGTFLKFSPCPRDSIQHHLFKATQNTAIFSRKFYGIFHFILQFITAALGFILMAK